MNDVSNQIDLLLSIWADLSVSSEDTDLQEAARDERIKLDRMIEEREEKSFQEGVEQGSAYAM